MSERSRRAMASDRREWLRSDQNVMARRCANCGHTQRQHMKHGCSGWKHNERRQFVWCDCPGFVPEKKKEQAE